MQQNPANVLPDSRLQDPKATVMADWEWEEPVGRPVFNGREYVQKYRKVKKRIELEPIYCFNCGKMSGYVPREVMSFVSWLCLPCSETVGEQASLWVSSDRDFWLKVGEEMRARFGRALTQRELFELGEQGRLGVGLELLARESPFKG